MHKRIVSLIHLPVIWVFFRLLVLFIIIFNINHILHYPKDSSATILNKILLHIRYGQFAKFSLPF